MNKLINFISLFILPMLLAIPLANAASHSDKEKKADTASETTTEAIKEENTEVKKEKAEGEEEEEPDCD